MYAACALRETWQAASLRELILEFQLLPQQLHDNRMRFVGRASGIYDLHSLRLAGRDRQIRVADASEKSAIFLLKTVLVSFRAFFRSATLVFPIAPPGALDGERHIVVQQNGQVGLQVPAED